MLQAGQERVWVEIPPGEATERMKLKHEMFDYANGREWIDFSMEVVRIFRFYFWIVFLKKSRPDFAEEIPGVH